jgi:hypothetical protein
MAKILPLKSFRFLTHRTGFGNQVMLSGSILAKVCNALELRYSQFSAKVRQLRGRHPRIYLPERISCCCEHSRARCREPATELPQRRACRLRSSRSQRPASHGLGSSGLNAGATRVACSSPASCPARTKSSIPGSSTGDLPAASSSTFSGFRSTPSARYPFDARHPALLLRLHNPGRLRLAFSWFVKQTSNNPKLQTDFPACLAISFFNCCAVRFGSASPVSQARTNGMHAKAVYLQLKL